MSNRDGGPAFACVESSGSVHQEGMTLRDYFAAAALTGLLAAEHEGFSYQGTVEEQADKAASQAGKIADAMIAEREKS
jgi:hypothetical protein